MFFDNFFDFDILVCRVIDEKVYRFLEFYPTIDITKLYNETIVNNDEEKISFRDRLKNLFSMKKQNNVHSGILAYNRHILSLIFYTVKQSDT